MSDGATVPVGTAPTRLPRAPGFPRRPCPDPLGCLMQYRCIGRSAGKLGKAPFEVF
jgi:hypothetical protein